MEEKNKDTNLAYKGDWCEQTAELARVMGNKEIMERNYRRAIEAYELGGWLDQAIRVAKIIDDSDKVRELEEKLR
ncbi:hypothetical protein FJZ18_00025 [Candidatus Pacearchaeota archaeon]|nr:hypothetical protein [Candidatus Pacearchaeota archaeon]